MKQSGVAVFGTLLCTVLSLPLKVKEEHKTAFFGEDVHITLPSEDRVEVLFRPGLSPTSEEVLMHDGLVLNSRVWLNTHRHLILNNVSEEDEGTYVIRTSQSPADIRHVILLVRDCSLEDVVKYGETYHFPLDSVTGPITLEFRPSHAQTHQANRTADEPPPVVLLSQTAGPAGGYLHRLSVTEKRVTLHGVRGTDEGSFTVLDRDGKVKKRNCLNVREHQTFVRLSYGHTLKINLYLDHTQVTVQYKPDSDQRERAIVDQGVVAPLEPSLDGRLVVEGSLVTLERVRAADMGLFVVTDLDGFLVANIYLEVESYKLPNLYVVVLSLLGLIAFLLLVCLVSCLLKVRQRAEKAQKITLIAQQAGKGDGDAFRQVVHEAYTRFSEDTTRSTWDNPTQTTEVTIKGLEVSKAGHYHPLSSDKNFLEMSDSGVEFNSSALPLDSDTDVPVNYASSKLFLNTDDHEGATIVEDDSPMSPGPASLPRSNAASTSRDTGVAVDAGDEPVEGSPLPPEVAAGSAALESEDQAPPEST